MIILSNKCLHFFLRLKKKKKSTLNFFLQKMTKSIRKERKRKERVTKEKLQNKITQIFSNRFSASTSKLRT